MRHRVSGSSSFGKKPSAGHALMRGLVSSLVEHERIKTTLPRAKYVRRFAEKAITIGKKGNLASRRLLLSRYPDKNTVSKIMDELAGRFKSRPGGFTRIIKLGPRAGDKADMAYLEFVDYKPPEKKKTTDKKDKQSQLKTVASKPDPRAKKKRRKHIRQIQNRSRRLNRPS